MAEATVNGVRLAYDIHGEGEPVLLVPATGQPAFAWTLSQVPALVGAGYQVITFGLRGMAPSETPPGPYTVAGMAEDTAALLDLLAVGPCRVAGYSLGSLITQELALARPDLVRAAVMMATMGRQDVFRAALTRSWVEQDESGIELPRLCDVVSAAFALFSPATLCDDDAMSLYIEGSLGFPGWSGPGRLGQHQADRDYQDRLEALKGITVPAMVIGFELDMGLATSLCREVAGVIPGCRYVEIAGAGHAGPFEKGDEVNAALIEFFAGV
ncbi:MAG: alpha/beta fold hydrolase [Acidimicrobiales bacterium]